MKLLLIYATTEGQTRRIFETLKENYTGAGHSAILSDATREPPPPGEFDAVVLGASVHVGSYQEAVRHYAKEHADALNAMPSAFVSVSLSFAAEDDEVSREEVRKLTGKFLDKTGWNPRRVEYVAGALRYTEYNWLKKFLMRQIAKKQGGETDTSSDHEYTNWDQVRQFAEEFPPE